MINPEVCLSIVSFLFTYEIGQVEQKGHAVLLHSLRRAGDYLLDKADLFIKSFKFWPQQSGKGSLFIWVAFMN
jgi:hypothetical protein